MSQKYTLEKNSQHTCPAFFGGLLVTYLVEPQKHHSNDCIIAGSRRLFKQQELYLLDSGAIIAYRVVSKFCALVPLRNIRICRSVNSLIQRRTAWGFLEEPGQEIQPAFGAGRKYKMLKEERDDLQPNIRRELNELAGIYVGIQYRSPDLVYPKGSDSA